MLTTIRTEAQEITIEMLEGQHLQIKVRDLRDEHLPGNSINPLKHMTLYYTPHDPAHDFDGGELMVVEQRPRAQSKGLVVNLKQGDAAVIAVNYRPRRSARGYSRVTLRHGVSPLSRGRRHTLGVIFHDAAIY